MAVKEWFRRFNPVQIYLILFFTSAFFIVEIIASHVTHSLTLLLNAYHMLCNIIALVGCIATIKYGHQFNCRGRSQCNSVGNSSICIIEKIQPSMPPLTGDSNNSCSDRRMKNTFGWARIDILTMLVCCVFLASFCFSLVVEALQTLVHPENLDAMHHPLSVMGIGISGILLNAFCYLIIGGYTFNQGLFLHVTKDGQLVLQKNVSSGAASAEDRLVNSTRRSPLAIPRRQGLQEMCRDVLGCVFVVIVSILVYITDPNLARFIDPVFAIIAAISLFVLSYPYVRESCMILLQTIPNHINIDSLKKELLEAFPGIVNVHDLHVWQLAGAKIISTAHIIFLDPMVYASITDQVTAFFVEMGITQVTIQPEFYKIKPDGNKTDCLIRCRGERCIQSQCCSKDELLNEIITDASEKCVNATNRKFLKKEIVPMEVAAIGLTKYTQHGGDSVNFDTENNCKQIETVETRNQSHTESNKNVPPTHLTVNEKNEMVGDETPIEKSDNDISGGALLSINLSTNSNIITISEYCAVELEVSVDKISSDNSNSKLQKITLDRKKKVR